MFWRKSKDRKKRIEEAAKAYGGRVGEKLAEGLEEVRKRNPSNFDKVIKLVETRECRRTIQNYRELAREKVAYTLPQIVGSVPERTDRVLDFFKKGSIGEGGLGYQYADVSKHLKSRRSRDRLEVFDRYERELDKDYRELGRRLAKRGRKVAVVIGLGVLTGGLYYLLSDVSITNNAVINLTNISSGFLVSIILICILGLVGYFYMKE